MFECCFPSLFSGAQYLRTNLGKAPNVSNDKIKEELGMVFRDLDETILQCAGDLVARDLVRDLD